MYTVNLYVHFKSVKYMEYCKCSNFSRSNINDGDETRRLKWINSLMMKAVIIKIVTFNLFQLTNMFDSECVRTVSDTHAVYWSTPCKCAGDIKIIINLRFFYELCNLVQLETKLHLHVFLACNKDENCKFSISFHLVLTKLPKL